MYERIRKCLELTSHKSLFHFSSPSPPQKLWNVCLPRITKVQNCIVNQGNGMVHKLPRYSHISGAILIAIHRPEDRRPSHCPRFIALQTYYTCLFVFFHHVSYLLKSSFGAALRKGDDSEFCSCICSSPWVRWRRLSWNDSSVFRGAQKPSYSSSSLKIPYNHHGFCPPSPFQLTWKNGQFINLCGSRWRLAAKELF